MSEKIKWYQEVLELEPNSKVFFPLARLLVAEGEAEEAVQTLKRGLERHPEFLEARLLLIELLYQGGHMRSCDSQIESLENMFSGYLGFWQAWAACLARKDSDSASLIRYIATQFIAGPLHLHDVINRGLEAILQERSAGSSGNTEENRPAQVSGKPLPDVELAAAPAEHNEPPVLSGGSDMQDDAPVAASVQDQAAAVTRPEDDGQGENDDPQELPVKLAAGIEEKDRTASPPFSLRTRSMAQVLAEQGDYSGAIDIYGELAKNSADPEEIAELNQRMADLKSLCPQAEQAESGNGQDKSKERLIGMLEALANRVEARVQN